MNKPNNIQEIPPLIKDLMDGHSTQNQLASKLWTTLAVASIITVLPYEITNTKIAIPLIDKEVSPDYFYSFCAMLISILFITFCNQHVQVIRSRKFLQRAIQEMSDPYLIPKKIHIQDVIDCTITSHLNRVAPLAQLFQGDYTFFPESNNRPRHIRMLSFSYYVIIKSLTLLVFYGLPVLAIAKSIKTISLFTAGFDNLSFFKVLLFPTSIVAGISLISLLITEIKFILLISRRILR
ncbi:MAG: hypothetical protein GX639_01355 [Fibrobacter sp.]|nr:hypothetical protein [Fibrobacter sp.]